MVDYTSAPPLPNSYKKNKITVNQHIFSLTNKNTITDENDTLIGFSKQKIFKIKDEINVYKSKDMKEEIFRIKQKNIVDVNANFEIVDSMYDSTVGYLKKKPLESIGKNKYVFLGPGGEEIGETKISGSVGSTVKSSLKGKWNYEVIYDDDIVASMKEKMTWTKYVFNIDFFSDLDYELDRRFPIAAALCIGGSKSNR